MELVTTMNKKNFSCNFDSGGYEIELKDLVVLAAKIMGNGTSVENNKLDSTQPPDIYKSGTNLYEELLNKFHNKEPTPLDLQIQEIYGGMFT
jgi:hypothetical protein